MYKRVLLATALLAAALPHLAGRDGASADSALQRARDAWDMGDYVAALTTYQELLAGADAASAVEPIALQTGELFRTTDLTSDGANPTFSQDGRWFSFETGPGVAAGVALGAGRITHVRAVASPTADLTTLDGGDASYCPDGHRVAFLRVPPSIDITRAQESLGMAAGAAERAPRQAALARLVARAGRIVMRDISTGRDEDVSSGDLLKTGVTCAADGAILFAGAPEADTTATQIYVVRAGSAPRALTQGDGFKVPSKIDAAGRILLFLLPRQGPFRQPAAGGGRGGEGGNAPALTDAAPTTDPPAPGVSGGRGGESAAATSFGVLSLSGTSTIVDGLAPALSRDGRSVAWLMRTGAATGGGEQRLFAGSTDNPSAAVEVRKGLDRLDAPALSADGSRLAYQVMTRDDWEIHVIGRDGKNDTRVTREIQHDVLPQFLGSDRLLGMVGEARHRRSYLYEMGASSSGTPVVSRTKLFDNNSIRTIAPEYAWAPSPDGTKLLIVAERDGDTVSPARGVHLVDLGAKVSVADLRTRIAAQLQAERALREQGRRTFAPIATAVRTVTSAASAGRVYAHEKALFDFGSKHITRPGNKLASEYLYNAYASFGYTPEYQYFSPRQAAGNQTANVLATLKGTVNPELVYVVSSHYDSVAIGPGADDDTSGTAALLETARILAGHPMPATIVFASFTGEEAGLLGSREFVRRAVEGKVRIVGALNNDMIGWANDHRLDNTIRYSNPGIRDVQHGAAIGFTNMITYDALYYKNTDAAAYYEAYGDIVGGIGSYPVLGNPHYHQSHDLLEGINHQLVTEVAKTTAATLMLLASSPSRIAQLSAAAGAGSATASWSPSPETGVTGYIVTWGPADNPSLHTARVTQPRATLAGATPGVAVRVKAVNAKGLEGWDWARAVVK